MIKQSRINERTNEVEVEVEVDVEVDVDVEDRTLIVYRVLYDQTVTNIRARGVQSVDPFPPPTWIRRLRG